MQNFQTWVGAFLQALAQLGWTIGRNMRIDIRWATANHAEIRKQAAELVALAPDVILDSGTSTVGPLLQATRTVPIVFPIVVDPIGAGFVESLARPGGNATGFTQVEYGTAAKWLELLKEIAPHVTRAAILRDPAVPEGIGQFTVIQSAAPALKVEVSPVDIRNAGEIERALTEFAFAKWRTDLDIKRVGERSTRPDHQTCGQAPAARDLLFSVFRECWRPRSLRVRFNRSASARGQLR
jgi:putative tryptophan/tyrosine transport system substrate-binding protein